MSLFQRESSRVIYFPWQNQAAKGVELRMVPRRAGEVHVRDLIQRVDERTRMIAVSWVGYASGFCIDLTELVEEAHRRSVLVFLDAIQGLGVFPLDLRSTPVDFLAADGHKWLLGPEGNWRRHDSKRASWTSEMRAGWLE